MLIPNISPKSSSDKSTQRKQLYTLMYFLCVQKENSRTAGLRDFRAKGQQAPRAWRPGPGIGGWGVMWVDADSRSGVLSEPAFCGVP